MYNHTTQSHNCVLPLTSSVFGPYDFGWALLSILMDFLRQEHCGKWGKAKQSALRIWGAELIKTSFEEQRDAPNVSSMLGMQVFMLRLSLCRLHDSPQMLFFAYLSFHSFSLNLQQYTSMNSVLSLAVLFSLYWYLVPRVEKWLFLSLFSLFSVGTTAAQSAAGSVTPWTQMTSTPARPLAPTSTPHLSHAETWMNRSVIETRASWSTESETSAEVHMRNNFKAWFSFHLEKLFSQNKLKWFYYFIWLSVSLFYR